MPHIRTIRSPFYMVLCIYIYVMYKDCQSVILLENGRYGHAPIRSDTSIRVYTTADTDTDTSTPCVMVSH